MSLIDALYLDPAPFHVWIADRKDQQRGAGTITDPYNGGLDRAMSPQFDPVMNGLPAGNLVVHLGPGTFVTKGYADSVTFGWKARVGMKIVGSGLANATPGVAPTLPGTTLKLVAPSGIGKVFFAVGHDLTSTSTMADAFEISDLTVDVNLAGNVSAIACGAIRIMGNHVRIRRVSAINWGSNSTTVRGFVFSVLTAVPDAVGGPLEAVNAGIEDCYAISPGPTISGGKVTIFNVGGQDDLLFSKEVHAKSPFIRNCYVDCGVANPDPAGKYTGLSMGWCRGGVVEGNQVYNTDLGGPYQDQRSIRDGIVRNNFLKNVAVGIKIQSVAVTITVSGLASMAAGTGVVSGGGMDLNLWGVAPGDRVLFLNGSTAIQAYMVTGVVANTFTVGSTTLPTPNSFTVKILRSIGRLIIEGNVIELATGGSAKQAIVVDDGQVLVSGAGLVPDYVHGDVFVRGNKIRYVDGVSPQVAYTGSGTQIYGTKNVQVANMVIDVNQPAYPAPTQPMQNFRCGSVTYFNNQTSSGAVVEGAQADGVNNSTKRYTDIQTQADDAFVMAFAEGR